MSSHSKICDDMIRSIKCAICNAELKNYDFAHESGFLFAIICRKCYRTYSSNDIELMINMFCAFGGYFGKYTPKDDCCVNLLFEESKIKGKKITIQGSLKMLHKALLFGVTPQQFFERFNCNLKL